MKEKQPSGQPSNEVHILVFKDNYASRQFSISLHWFTRLGILIGILVLLALASIAIAVKMAAELRHVRHEFHEFRDKETQLSNALSCDTAAQSRAHSAPLPITSISPQPSTDSSPVPAQAPAEATFVHTPDVQHAPGVSGVHGSVLQNSPGTKLPRQNPAKGTSEHP